LSDVGAEPGGEPETVEVFRSVRAGGCDERLLVLESRGIAALLLFRGAYYAVEVAAADAPRARAELERYAAENPPRRIAPAPRLHDGAIQGALFYVLVLFLVAVAASRQLLEHDWYALGVLDGQRVRSGEWWRALTALTLHADGAHLAANAGFGALFGVPLARLYGAGLAWAAVLAAALLANLADAALMPAGSAALGASTAVFAALGILGSRGRAMFGVGRGRAYRAAGVVGAVVLLAFLGTGDAHTDILGHAAGFLAGLLAGVALARLGLPGGALAQRAYGTATLAALALAWGLAFRHTV
jgi:membrane associated rhomboid family serine protease